MQPPSTTNPAAAAPRRDVDLSSAARLELGLTALAEGNVPAAAAALALLGAVRAGGAPQDTRWGQKSPKQDFAAPGWGRASFPGGAGTHA